MVFGFSPTINSPEETVADENCPTPLIVEPDIVPEFIETEYNEHKFKNYKEYVLKDLLKKFITLKSELYYNDLKDTCDFEKINFKEIEKKLGFDDIKDHDEWCKNNDNSPKNCCCL